MRTLFKQRGLWAAGLVLTLMVGCKKETDNAMPTPVAETNCQIGRQSDNDVGSNDFVFNPQGFVTRYTRTYKDDQGKTVADISDLVYNAQGLLERLTSKGPANFEVFSYTNGLLSKIEVNGGGKKVYQWDVTTNAQKQITAMKGTSFDKDNYEDFSSVLTYDGQGYLIKSEITDTALGKVAIRNESSGYKAGLKDFRRTLKGWPIDVMQFFYYYGDFGSLSGQGPQGVVTAYSAYDDKGNIGNTFVKEAEETAVYKANSKQFVTDATYTNTLDKKTRTLTHTYSNCN